MPQLDYLFEKTPTSERQRAVTSHSQRESRYLMIYHNSNQKLVEKGARIHGKCLDQGQ